MNIRYSVLLFIIALAGLASCKDNDNVFKPVIPSFINVVNATADTLNFFVNGTRQNNTSSLYPSGQTLYFQVTAGLQNYQLKKSGSPVVLFSLPLTLKDSVQYSIYIAGETADKSFNTVDFLDTTGINTTLAKVRFVNASPDAGSVSVTVGDTTGFFNSSAFKSSSSFLLLGPSGLKRVKVYVAGSATPKVDTTLSLQPSHLYTLFSRGLINGKGDAGFTVGLATNF
jgi:hypothetical protein